MAHVIHYFKEQPFILLFLVVAAGYAIGKVKFKGDRAGGDRVHDLIGLALSLLASARDGRVPDPDSRAVFFNLFMFSVGMKVGPSSSAAKDARHFILLGIFTPLLAAGLALACQALFKMPAGMAAGSGRLEHGLAGTRRGERRPRGCGVAAPGEAPPSTMPWVASRRRSPSPTASAWRSSSS